MLCAVLKITCQKRCLTYGFCELCQKSCVAYGLNKIYAKWVFKFHQMTLKNSKIPSSLQCKKLSITFQHKQHKIFNFTACWEREQKKLFPWEFFSEFFLHFSFRLNEHCGMWLAYKHRRLSILLHFKYFSLLSCFFKGFLFYFKDHSSFFYGFVAAAGNENFSHLDCQLTCFFWGRVCDVLCGRIQHGKWW